MNAISKWTMAFVFLCAAMAVHAASIVKATPASGHPTAAITVSGTAFGDLEAIDVYVDTVDTLLLVSSATGTFSGSVTIPATASPGKHYITAIGRKSGDAAQVAFTVTTPWAELGFGAAARAWNPWENTLTTGNVSSLGPLWTSPTNTVDDSPAVVNGRVYVASYGGLGIEALNVSTGAVLWSKATTDVFEGATPAVAGGVVYVGGTQSPYTFYALNATTGATIWTQTVGGPIYSSAVVANGNVYVGSTDGNVYAFKASTGAPLWTYTTGAAIEYSSPAVVDGTLYIGSDDAYIYAINATTGVLDWKFMTGGLVFSSPAVVNGVVYVGTNDFNLYAISAEATFNAGTLLWRAATGGDVISSPAVAYNTVFVGSYDGNLYAFNARTGALKWSFFTTGEGIKSPVTVANGVVYVGASDGFYYALDATDGSMLWLYDVVGGTFLSRMIVSDGIAYANSYQGETFAFALQAGNNAVLQNLQPPALSSLHPDMSLTVMR